MRVQLARMGGKLDLSNARHDQTDRRLDNHETRIHRHSSDISTLQAKALLTEGRSQGLAIGGKLIWAAVGFAPGAILAMIKLFGG